MASRTKSFDKEMGMRVRRRREALGISQTMLGDALGVTFQQVQKYETGANRISVGRLQVLSEALSVSVSYFLEDDALPRPRNADAKNEALPLSAVNDFLMSP